jgi:glutathione S-transferase
MSDTITLYGYKFISRAERIIWVLNELALPYELIRLDPFKGETLTEEFLQLNPRAKVPVLLHGDKILTESVAIAEYLHFLCPEKQLMPTAQDDYYRYRHWMSYMVSELEPYLWIADQSTRIKDFYRWSEGTEKTAVGMVKKNLPVLLEELDRLAQSAGEALYIAAEHFTIADVFAFQVLYWATSYDLKLNDAAQHYLSTLKTMPSFPEKV